MAASFEITKSNSNDTHDLTINMDTTSPKPSLPLPSSSTVSPNIKFHGILYGVVCGIILWIIPYPLYLCIAISVTPFLLFSFIITRLLQFFHYNLKYVSDVKRLIRTMLAFLMFILMFGMAVIVIPVINTRYKYVHYMKVPISDWVTCIVILCGFYLFSTIIYIIVMVLFNKKDERQFHPNLYAVPEAITEIIDCLVLWWAEYEILNRIPALKVDQTFFQIPTYEFIQVVRLKIL